jgi:hypothetical protein
MAMICESLRSYHCGKLFVQYVIFQKKESFHEFLLDLKESNVVYFRISIKPFQVSIEVC